jgi:hypothetical protein
MLFANKSDGDNPAVTIGEGFAKDPLGQEDPFRVVSQSPVPEVGKVGFAFVEEVMNRQIVVDHAAILSDATQGVMVRMGHGQTPD